MKKLVYIIALVTFLFLPSCVKETPVDGRFNVVPWEEPEISTTTTTTVPSYDSRWPSPDTIRKVNPPTPFEEGEPTKAPYGCEEGQERGVDC